MDRKKKATIADVAELAGVSIKTVSRVANNEPNVRPKTRHNVAEAIRKLGYQPNPSARALAARRSYLVGLLYDNPSPSYLVKVQNGALRACRAEGYDLVIHPCDYKAEDLTDSLVRMIRQSRVDGVILTPPLSEKKTVVKMLKKTGTPFVRISPGDNQYGNRSIVTNDEQVCAKMTTYLIELGHREIGFICGHPDHQAVTSRFAGYERALAEADLRVRRRLIRQGYNSMESGESCAESLLTQKSQMTAIFAANDDMATGALRAAHKLGIDVPGKLSVVGFDDTPIASQVWPALTTIRQPIQAMSEQATILLLRELRDLDARDVQREIPCSLVVRDSTGPAPA